MRTVRIPITVALLGALTASCGEVAPTASDETLPGPSFNFSNGPTNPGPFVVRGNFNAFLLNANSDGSLVSVNGLGTLDPNQSVVCGGATIFDLVEFQDIENPSGALNELDKQEGTKHIYADAATFFSQLSLCDALNLPRLAEGRGQLVATDNDLQVSGTRANAFGFRMQGTLDDLVNGGKAHYNEVLQLLIGKNGSFRVLRSEINLKHVGN